MEDEFKIPHFKIYAIVLGTFTVQMLFCNCINQYLTAFLAIFLISGNRPYWLYVISKTLTRDMKIIKRLACAAFQLRKFSKNNMTLPKIYNTLVKKHPDKIVFHTEKRSWTYKELSDLSNRLAHMFKRSGLERGEVIGLMLKNGGAEMPALWLSAATLRAPAALLPPHLRGATLVHAISAAKLTALLYSDDLAEVIEEIADNPELKRLKLFQYNLVSEHTPLLKNSISVMNQLESMPTTFLSFDVAQGNCNDVLLYIYTSGTTGLPKAAIIRHQRYFMISVVTNKLSNLNVNDIIYDPLPLHHTTGATLGVGQALIYGLTVTLRGKFSTSNFWKDCIKYKCTVFFYIGEMCRFLLSAAEKSDDGNTVSPHSIKLIIGSGLRVSIWKRFQKTFSIQNICELYGSTEGNTNLVNIVGKVGAIGFVPRFLSFISPYALVRCDHITGELIRDKSGLCIPCKPCEPGLILGKLKAEDLLYSFTGYVDKEATKTKIVKNVYSTGDTYFNSGDILTMDHFGYYYFTNRTGDTFRWRGENVSTTEVENVISSIIGLKNNVAVFGVEVADIEGNAGMAAIVNYTNSLDLLELYKKMSDTLPSYAIPMFIRVVPELEMTKTFKLIKRNLVIDGFNINKFPDPVYFLDPARKGYIPMTADIYDDIMTGKFRL